MPSLTSLRAFEAAARLGSFARAAEELLTTAAGVAQHVKKVEAWAGQTLFERSARGVTLSHAGEAALPELTKGFGSIARACLELRSTPSTLRIAALPALAQLWVVPRMGLIRSMLPHANVSVDATDISPDLESSEFDVAIFYESISGDSGGDSDQLTPMASPELARELRTPDDLAHQTLLHDRAWHDHWALWLAQAEAPSVRPTDGSSFTLYAMAIEAALNGDGVLIGRTSLLDSHLADGRLVAPFDLRVASMDAVRVRFRQQLSPSLKPLRRLLTDVL